MNILFKTCCAVFTILICSFETECQRPASKQLPADHVNLFIGTSEKGNTVPAATAPFGMISCGPDNVFDEAKDEFCSRSGYNYAKDSIRSFSMTHVSGWGCHGALDIPVMPTTKSPGISPVFNHRAYASKFSHKKESAAPGFYEVFLEDHKTNVRITATERSAILLFDFPDEENASVVFAPTNCANGITSSELTIDPGNKQVTGWATSGGFCWRNPKEHDYTVYFVASFDHPITGKGIWNKKNMERGAISAAGDSIAAFISFGNRTKTIEMRVAISFVSIENAIANLEAELNGKSFTEIKDETSKKWNELLRKVDVETDNRDLKVNFYSGLYRNFLHPNIFNDVNGEYRGFNDSIYKIPQGHNKYVNYSSWDTYRTTAYLQGLLVPDRASDMIESLYLDAKEGNPAGLTIWGYFNNETWVMNGHSSIPLIANQYAMGARNIDLKKIKDIMIWTADNKYRNGDEYIQYGYVPERPAPHNYCVSQTIEYSLADFGLAQICKADGDMENYNRFLKRSSSVFNNFNKEKGYLQRKGKDGSWVMPFNPGEENGFNEGNSAQYTWNIAHKLDELVDYMGGPEKTIARLDEFTSVIHTNGWPVDQPHYWPGNEPGFVVPFVYTYAGAHDKAQKLIRQVSTTIFKNSPDGLPGDDDLGATSAMYLFFSLGMYPLKPGIPEFCLSGSFFKRIRIKLDNGSEITAATTGDPLSGPIKEITVNGKLLGKPFININNIIDKPGKLGIKYKY